MSGHASVRKRIDELYKNMTEALGKYLSPGLVNELQEILNDAMRANPTSSPAE